MSSDRHLIGAAAYLILLKDDQVLLSRRCNTSWMNGKYSLIAGHIEPDESVFDCVIREAFEEAGIHITKPDLIPATVLHRHSSDREYSDFFFVAHKWSGQPTIMEPEKCDDLRWFHLNKLPEEILPHVVEAIKNYQSKVAFSESGWN